MTWRPTQTAWLAGFTDGEGHFGIPLNPQRGTATPRFQISLRIDDAPVLEDLKQAFGGSLYYERSRANGTPNCVWTVSAKHQLGVLVAYFDRFPLRAKKAADYALWKQAVRIYCARSAHDPQLVVLREALMAGRKFDAVDMPCLDDPFEVQLGLGIEAD